MDSANSILKAIRSSATLPHTFSLLLWWIVTSVIALSYAGERMPWLTYHMVWPMVLLTGWGIGHLIDNINWGKLRRYTNRADS